MDPDARRPPEPRGGTSGALELGAALERALRHRRPAELAIPGRRAAVLLVLHDLLGEAHLVLTKRTETMPSHPGQVSLPGGVSEAGDGSLRDTALRETEEEIGIPAAALRVVGELDDVPTMASGFIIRPFVAVMPRSLEPTPSDAEVARVLQVPVAELMRADAALPVDPAPLALRYPLAGEDVWGATARILRIFCGVLRDALSAGGPAPSPEGAGPAR